MTNALTLKYTGKTAYRDRTLLRTIWQPGDIKSIPTQEARRLLKFREFEVAEDAKPDAESQVAQYAAKVQEQDSEKETMLLTVEGWDKSQLEAYARQYSVELDKRKSLANLRLEVSTLIEQFGVR